MSDKFKNQIDWSRVNWKGGVNRVYNLIWAILALSTIVAFFEMDLEGKVLIASVFWIGPFFYRKILVWVFAGFIKEKGS